MKAKSNTMGNLNFQKHRINMTVNRIAKLYYYTIVASKLSLHYLKAVLGGQDLKSIRLSKDA